MPPAVSRSHRVGSLRVDTPETLRIFSAPSTHQGLSSRTEAGAVTATSTPTVEIANQILGLVGLDPAARRAAEDVEKALRACSREKLVGFARELGLAGVTKLAKDALAGRIGAALSALRGGAMTADAYADASSDDAYADASSDDAYADASSSDASDDASKGSLVAKFELGPGAANARPPATIPWGYGGDRVTAMAVDPQRLFVYWEVTDGAIEAARKQLGAAGAGAWLSLRVYDITGRLFDGTNAHSYFDEGVGRDVRQWFFEIGKPTSTVCIEVGMKSSEGYFVKIARSGRVEFSRDAPQPASSVEWLTVRTATGHAGEPVAGGAPRPDGYAQSLGHSGDSAANSDDWQGWTDGAGFPVPGGARGAEGGTAWREVTDQTFHGEVGRVEWMGPVHRSEWQAGPFEQPIDAPASLVEYHETGEVSSRDEHGVVHVSYGPWQVVIRGAGARAERRVLATWEYHRVVELPGGFARDAAAGEGEGRWEPIDGSSSAWRYVARGASERRWLGASELLYRGGSEVWLMGASERLFRGASERMFRGASERRFRGASERLYRGASERRFMGASEWRLGGAEHAAEHANVGALGGASERLAGGGRAAGESAPATWDEASPYPRPER